MHAIKRRRKRRCRRRLKKINGEDRRLTKKIEEDRRLKNKAGYTATLVACGWAGAAKKAKRDLSVTDGRTDGPTD